MADSGVGACVGASPPEAAAAIGHAHHLLGHLIRLPLVDIARLADPQFHLGRCRRRGLNRDLAEIVARVQRRGALAGVRWRSVVNRRKRILGKAALLLRLSPMALRRVCSREYACLLMMAPRSCAQTAYQGFRYVIAIVRDMRGFLKGYAERTPLPGNNTEQRHICSLCLPAAYCAPDHRARRVADDRHHSLSLDRKCGKRRSPPESAQHIELHAARTSYGVTNKN